MRIVMEEQIEKVQVKTNWTDNTQNVTVFFFLRQKTWTEKTKDRNRKRGTGTENGKWGTGTENGKRGTGTEKEG